MTQEEFIKILNRNKYPYRIEGDKIIVTYTTRLRSVDLEVLTSLPPGVEFSNEGYINLRALTSLPLGVVFKNGGDVYLGLLIGRWFNEWESNIEGIDSKMLLNVMIKQGVFI